MQALNNIQFYCRSLGQNSLCHNHCQWTFTASSFTGTIQVDSLVTDTTEEINNPKDFMELDYISVHTIYGEIRRVRVVDK